MFKVGKTSFFQNIENISWIECIFDGIEYFVQSVICVIKFPCEASGVNLFCFFNTGELVCEY